MYRTKSYRRYQRQRVIDWKKRFIKQSGSGWHYEHEGTLAKGKIHCSCWMCRYRGELLDKREKLLDYDMEQQIKEYGETNE
jgi:hypothetical protein